MIHKSKSFSNNSREVSLADFRDEYVAARSLRRSAFRIQRFLLLFFVFILGCSKDLSSPESILHPAGPQADRISHLTWLFLYVCFAVYALVMLFLLGALLHRRRGKAMVPTDLPLEPEENSEKRTWTTVFTAIVVTVITLFVLLIADFATGRALYKMSNQPHALKIQITGHQWWWEVRYLDWPDRFGDRSASNTFSTANEIHIPIDPANPVMVDFALQSHDVIHSFWIPSLDGKRDLIPGHNTDLWFRADKPGTYWGECAEYCGYQHANMRLVLVAQPVDEFQKWLDHQRQQAADPKTPQQLRGKQVFMGTTCATCHSISGTNAGGRIGPDLTHVASRKIIAAGALMNSRGAVAGWIADPQKIKPGTQMPRNTLAPQDLRALLEYVETLK